RSSAGMLLMVGSFGSECFENRLAVAHKRRTHQGYRALLVANFHLGVASTASRHACQGNGETECWRKGAGGDFSRALVGDHFLVRTQYTFFLHYQADQFGVAVGLLLF